MSTPVKKVPIHLQSSQNRLLIKNGNIVNEDGVIDEDVYIEDGIIKQVGRNLIIPGGTRIIDARGRYIMPGGIDPHTHFESDFFGTTSVDDFYQGTKAAIAGGTTMIIDFVFAKKGESILDAYFAYREKADSKVCCDYGLHVAITNWSDRVKEDMGILCSHHGINSFKMFMAYAFMLNDSELYSIFEQCKKLGAVPQVHAENGHIIIKNVEKLLAKGITGPEGHEMSRPEEVEAEAVNRACTIAQQATAIVSVFQPHQATTRKFVKVALKPDEYERENVLATSRRQYYHLLCYGNTEVDSPLYVVHVMSKSAGFAIKRARESGTRVIAETLVCGLAKDGSNYKHSCFQHSAAHVLSPPLRPDPTTPQFLMNFLAQDVLQLTGSDHCTFRKEQKEMGINDFSKIPNGVNGVEDRMSVIWEKGVHAGIISPSRFVAITSTNAAKIFNIYPRKGCIAVGSDADIVIWNPNKTRVISAKTHNQAVDFNIFEGMECHGIPEYVIVNGRVCVDEEQLRVVQGHGRFVETPVFPPFIYDSDKLTKPTKNGTFGEVELSHEFAKTELEPPLCNTPTLPNSVVGTPSCRGARPEGQRNIQESTFSVSEELDVERKSCIRVKNPPGGKSSGFW